MFLEQHIPDVLNQLLVITFCFESIFTVQHPVKVLDDFRHTTIRMQYIEKDFGIQKEFQCL